MCRAGGPRCAGHMKAALDAAHEHIEEIERRIAAKSIPAYQAQERRASAQRRLDRAQRNFDTTLQGIQARIKKLNSDPDAGDPSRDPERQAILDDTLEYQRQLAAHRKDVQEVAKERRQKPEQVVADILSSGGFTHDFTRGMTPTVGYMVSIPGPEKKIRLAGKSPRELTASLRRFAREHQELLRDPRHYIGGWVKESTGVLYLDVSLVETDVKKVRQMANEYEQEAFYDAQCGQEVFVNEGISDKRDNFEEEGK